ncbi:MAG: Holliday junction resolvase RuvX [Rickettsiaceae bacterium]|nr:Holliday junction resolvase RuvX [Rickettsiaceae bacterium]
MIIQTLKEFCQILACGKRLIAIDYGSKKLGIAISDPGLNMALPMKEINETNDQQKIVQILTIFKTNLVSAIVIGLPINMDGSFSVQTEVVLKFADKLAVKTNLPIFLQDERLTTRAADNLLKIGGLKRKERNARDDSVAACLILHTVLSYYNKNKPIL